MVAKKEKIVVLYNESGQAMFELIVFLPLFMMIFFLLLNIGASLNGAINQQKITRGYYYARIKNDSLFPDKSELDGLMNSGVNVSVGFMAIGWRETEEAASGSEQAMAPCYKIASILSSGPNNEKCEDKIIDEKISTFVKVKTVYGICGPVWRMSNNQWVLDKRPFTASSGSCILQ